MSLKSEYWLDVVRREYLRDFIRLGGAAVKFVVPTEGVVYEDLKNKLREDLHKLAREERFQFIFIDSKTTKIHMIDKLFHEIARQIDWEKMAHHFLNRLLTAEGLRVPGNSKDFNLRQIASLNELEEQLLRTDIKRMLTKAIFHDYEMSQEFRLAMMRLCMARLEPVDVNPYLSKAIKEWLCGELRLISTLKEALIFQKVARHNARYLLFSLAHWLRVNGMNGLVLCLDISRYMTLPRPINYTEGFYYTSPATLDAYEVLRQFVDGTDELEGCFITVIAPREFLTDDRRGLNRYDALKLRIWDEVRDRRRQNPLSSLIRISYQ